MKCPKCGYNSFDHLNDCKKCGQDLSDHKGKFGLHSLLFPRKKSSPEEPAQDEKPSANEGPAGLGFDFMDSEEPPETEDSSLEDLLGEEKESPAPAEPPAVTAESAWHEPEEAFEEPAAQSAPLSSLEAEAADPFGMEEGSGPDFNLNWEEESSLREPEGTTTPETGEIFEFDGPEADEEDESGIADEAPDALPDDREPEPDLASLFLDSLEESPDISADSPETPDDFDPFAPTSEPDASSGGLPGGSFDFAAAEPLPESDFTIEERETSLPSALHDETSDPAAEEETEPSDPEGAPASHTKPGLVSRIGAGTADLLLLVLIFALFVTAGELALAPGDRGGLLPSVERLAELSIPYFLVLFALSFGYFTLFHFLAGQTPGKMLFGLRVETEEGADLLLSQAFLRSVGGLLSLLPAGLGFLRICLDPQGRGWSDHLAGSRVVPVHTALREGWEVPEEMQEEAD